MSNEETNETLMKDVQKSKEHTVPKKKVKIDLTSGCLRTAAVISLEMKNCLTVLRNSNCLQSVQIFTASKVADKLILANI